MTRRGGFLLGDRGMDQMRMDDIAGTASPQQRANCVRVALRHREDVTPLEEAMQLNLAR